MENKLEQKKNTRIWELDFLRGLAIILVVLDHFVFDIDYVGSTWVSHNPNNKALADVILFFESIPNTKWYEILREYIFVPLFFIISGISSSFSRNNYVRALKIGVFAAILSIVTSIAQMPIYFGVLHCFACIILIYAILQTLLKKDVYKVGYFSLALAALTLVTNECLKHYANITTPSAWAFISSAFPSNITSFDYFPILDFIHLFLFGAFLSLFYIKRQSLIPKLELKVFKPICFCGRHSIWFYLLHQVILIPLIALLSYFCFSKGDWGFF